MFRCVHTQVPKGVFHRQRLHEEAIKRHHLRVGPKLFGRWVEQEVIQQSPVEINPGVPFRTAERQLDELPDVAARRFIGDGKVWLVMRSTQYVDRP